MYRARSVPDATPPIFGGRWRTVSPVGRTWVSLGYLRSGQVLEQGWQVGEGLQDVVGRAAGVAVGTWQVFAGLDKNPGESLALGGENVALDVVTHHQRVRCGGAKVCQRGGEERGGGLTNHLRFDAGRLFQARHKRAAVQLQAI